MTDENEKYNKHRNSMEYDDRHSWLHGINLEVLVTKLQWAESEQHQQAAHTEKKSSIYPSSHTITVCHLWGLLFLEITVISHKDGNIFRNMWFVECGNGKSHKNVSDKTNNNRFLTLGTRERKGNWTLFGAIIN